MTDYTKHFDYGNLVNRYPTEKARCSECGRGIYTTPVKTSHGPICAFCDFDSAVVQHEDAMIDHARTMAALNTPPVCVGTPIDGSKITPGDVWQGIEAHYHGDTPEVTYSPLDEDSGEWIEEA